MFSLIKKVLVLDLISVNNSVLEKSKETIRILQRNSKSVARTYKWLNKTQ